MKHNTRPIGIPVAHVLEHARFLLQLVADAAEHNNDPDSYILAAGAITTLTALMEHLKQRANL